MRKFGIWAPALGAALLAAAPATAATTLGVTTDDASKWTIIAAPVGEPTDVVNVDPINPAWAKNAPWLSNRTDGKTGGAAGLYTFVYTLDQAASFDNLFTRIWVDNRLLQIFANTNTLLADFSSDTNNRQFEGAGRLINLDISGIESVTSVSFVTRNAGGPLGISAAVPEPGTWILMILGLGAVGFAMRRRQRVSARLQFA